MKYHSKKRGGFTLIEIIISMAVITIISVSVYNGFKIMIKGTKQGEVKQTSTLIGNQISEQIKAVSEKKSFTTNSVDPTSLIIDLTDHIHLTKETGERNYTSLPLYFDEDGQLGNPDDRYKVTIDINQKEATDDNNKNTPVIIEEVLNSNNDSGIENRNISIIKADKDKGAEMFNGTSNSVNVEGDKTVTIDITDAVTNSIKIGSDELSYLNYSISHKDNKQQITMDLKHCTGKITIEVTNGTKIPFNLFILNGNNVEVINKKGILHEYRRSEIGGKIGTLYDVNIQIFDQKSVDGFKTKPIFNTSFAQNININ